MSLHQKRVTITAVDLSKVSDTSILVAAYYGNEAPSPAELRDIEALIARTTNKAIPAVAIKAGTTLTVEQLPPRTEQQIIADFEALAAVQKERRKTKKKGVAK